MTNDIALKPCPFCGVKPAPPFQNLRDGEDDEVVKCWTIQHPCKAIDHEIWTHADASAEDCAAVWNTRALPAQGEPVAREIRKIAADAIRTFCQSLGSNVVVRSADGMERIYYAGISLDALAAAVALAALPSSPAPTGCICQDQHRLGYCTEPGCPNAAALLKP